MASVIATATVVGVAAVVVVAGSVLLVWPFSKTNHPAEPRATPVRILRPLSRLARAVGLLYQNRVPPSPWNRVGIVARAGVAFDLYRRRNAARRRWEYHVVDTNGVTINLNRDKYQDLVDDDVVDVAAYGDMTVHNDIDDEMRRHFEPV